jgi:hypothetical protein
VDLGRAYLMIKYQHRQVGTLVLCVVGVTVLLLASLFYFVEANPVGIAVLFILLLCVALFWALTVEVTESDVVLRFGFGLIRKRFPLSSIVNARAVRNRWYFGWGIRLLPKGWLYNVSGLDAVEIETTDGSVHRIGTDEPSELLRAIRDACSMTG